MFGINLLWKTPEINPVNGKARSIPLLNPIDVYGRVFFFAWFGFFVAFWSWYAFPPLMEVTIKEDLELTKVDIANSNIIALAATLLVRLAAGPLCDRFGSRLTFAGCLLIGAIPTALSGTANNPAELMALRFFIGILGGSFVPCQVWSTGFFDKNVVGTSNALTAGFGNAGGGITYFMMPAIFDSLVGDQNLRPHVAWRVAFIVPFICIVAVAVALLVLCPDTPTGKWSERHINAEQNLAAYGAGDVSDSVTGKKPSADNDGTPPADSNEKLQVEASTHKGRKGSIFADHEAQIGEQQVVDVARGEVIVKPSLSEAMHVVFSPQTLVTVGLYFCSFGAELAINSILGAYYLKNFPYLEQTGSGRWAAMFGLLNIVFRPLGGMISDMLYRRLHSVWAKKAWCHFLALITGAFLIAIGLTDSHDQDTMFGLVAGMAFFLEAGNGATFSLVPHIHPHANGIVSGCAGAAGNLGGIVFAIIFRYHGHQYGKVFWIIGVMTIGINVALCWIRPVPKGQVGGR